jgi:hypothetical protein
LGVGAADGCVPSGIVAAPESDNRDSHKQSKDRDQDRDQHDAIAAQALLAGKKIVWPLVTVAVTAAAPVGDLAGTSTAEPWCLFDFDAFGNTGHGADSNHSVTCARFKI